MQFKLFKKNFILIYHNFKLIFYLFESYFPVRAGECKPESGVICSRARSVPVMICVAVCKCPEGATLWEESAVDAATCTENLAGEETHRLLNVRLSLGSLETGCTTEQLFALQVAFV